MNLTFSLVDCEKISEEYYRKFFGSELCNLEGVMYASSSACETFILYPRIKTTEKPDEYLENKLLKFCFALNEGKRVEVLRKSIAVIGDRNSGKSGFVQKLLDTEGAFRNESRENVDSVFSVNVYQGTGREQFELGRFTIEVDGSPQFLASDYRSTEPGSHRFRVYEVNADTTLLKCLKYFASKEQIVVLCFDTRTLLGDEVAARQFSRWTEFLGSLKHSVSLVIYGTHSDSDTDSE